jgi:hypothetical protein
MGKSIEYMDPTSPHPDREGTERGVPDAELKDVSPKGIPHPPAPEFGMVKGDANLRIRRGEK